MAKFLAGLIQQIKRMGEPKNLDVSPDDVIAEPFYRGECLACSSWKDQQSALSRLAIKFRWCPSVPLIDRFRLRK